MGLYGEAMSRGKSSSSLPALLVIGVLASLVLGGYTAVGGVVYLGGERAVAHVDYCKTSFSTRSSHTSCHGTWHDSSGAHTGAVNGAKQSDVDHDVEVHALGDTAQLSHSSRLTVLSVLTVLVLAVTIGLAVAVVRRRRSRAA